MKLRILIAIVALVASAARAQNHETYPPQITLHEGPPVAITIYSDTADGSPRIEFNWLEVDRCRHLDIPAGSSDRAAWHTMRTAAFCSAAALAREAPCEESPQGAPGIPLLFREGLVLINWRYTERCAAEELPSQHDLFEDWRREGPGSIAVKWDQIMQCRIMLAARRHCLGS